MDPTRDNPIIRFATFWWGLAPFLVFALLLAGIWIFNRKAPDSLEDVVARARYETKAKIAQAQADSLPQKLVDEAIPAVAEKLAASKPVAVEKPDQVVPGSPTAAKIAPPAPVTPPATATPPATGAVPAPGTPPVIPPAGGSAPVPAEPPVKDKDAAPSGAAEKESAKP
jgi:hypothetical protein